MRGLRSCEQRNGRAQSIPEHPRVSQRMGRPLDWILFCHGRSKWIFVASRSFPPFVVDGNHWLMAYIFSSLSVYSALFDCQQSKYNECLPWFGRERFVLLPFTRDILWVFVIYICCVLTRKLSSYLYIVKPLHRPNYLVCLHIANLSFMLTLFYLADLAILCCLLY